MPLPFLAWGAAAALATMVATSEKCKRCGDTFWSSDCKRYCDDCCAERKSENRAEAARNTVREKENDEYNTRVRARIEDYKDRRVTYIEDKYDVAVKVNSLEKMRSSSGFIFGQEEDIKILFDFNSSEDYYDLETQANELNELRKELEDMKDELS